MIKASHLGLGLSVLTAVVGMACRDPVISDAKDELGDEDSAISPGPYHRAGQPCLVCHSERGGETEFTVAGTIFASATRQVGVDGAEIRMTDADGTQHTTKTNCVGNFFVKPNEWVPKFPVLVAVAKGGTRRSMQSVIGRDGSCAHCHSLNVEKSATGAAVDPKKVAQVYLFGGDEPSAPNGALDCPAPAKKPGSP
jgi:hypothetical protein